METVLAFDTALAGCSAAVARGGKILASESRPMARGQSEELMPMVVRVMKKAGLEFTALDAVCTARGPGAFTGLRIGLSAARALGLALGVPVIGLITTEILARQYLEKREAEILCAVVETKRSDFYYQFFDGQGAALSEPGAAEGAALAALVRPGTVFIGDAVERFRPFAADMKNAAFVTDCILPDPGIMALMAGEKEGGNDIRPLYLRDADVSVAKRKSREIEY
jgi:tRNA threonylcarbamoyladenosine biosynthesis protein TsaB